MDFNGNWTAKTGNEAQAAENLAAVWIE